MFHLNTAEREPFRVELQLNGVQTSMEVDTGTAATIINEEKFHQYIYGRHFSLVTDHKPLESLFSEKKATPPMAAARIQRRALTLAACNYSIEYKPGPQHANADALSRLPLLVSPSTTPLPAETVFAMELLNSTPVSVNEIRTGTRHVSCRITFRKETQIKTRPTIMDKSVETFCQTNAFRLTIILFF